MTGYVVHAAATVQNRVLSRRRGAMHRIVVGKVGRRIVRQKSVRKPLLRRPLVAKDGRPRAALRSSCLRRRQIVIDPQVQIHAFHGRMSETLRHNLVGRLQCEVRYGNLPHDFAGN